MAKVWVDPPSGWRFGFPAVWDMEKHPDMMQWLNEKGYQMSIVKELGQYFYVRQWEYKEGEKE